MSVSYPLVKEQTFVIILEKVYEESLLFEEIEQEELEEIDYTDH